MTMPTAADRVMFICYDLRRSLCTSISHESRTAQQTTETERVHDGRRHNKRWGRFSFIRQRSLLHCIARQSTSTSLARNVTQQKTTDRQTDRRTDGRTDTRTPRGSQGQGHDGARQGQSGLISARMATSSAHVHTDAYYMIDSASHANSLPTIL